MDEGENRVEDLRYKRAKFAARFPRDRSYSASHFWLQQRQPGTWRIGYTKFAMRMLGEPVEVDFEVKPGSEVELGQVVGWLEGFKAVTDLYAPMPGRFVGANPGLQDGVAVVKSSPYRAGWLYEMEGSPGEDCFDAEGYAKFLDGTIDKMMGQDG